MSRYIGWIQFAGHYRATDKMPNGEWDYAFNGEPLVEVKGDDKDWVWKQLNTIWKNRKFTMAWYMHDTHPWFDEIDLNYSVTNDEDGICYIGDEDFTEVLWLEE